MFSFSSNKKLEKGQGLVEYAIILALVAIVVIGVMRVLGPKVGCTFSGINTSMPGGSGGSSSNCGGGTVASYTPGGTPQDFGNTDFEFDYTDSNAAIDEYCAQHPGGGYNLYHWNSGFSEYYAQGDIYPNFPQMTFQGTGICGS